MSYCLLFETDRTRENEFSNLKVKPKGQKACWLFFYIRDVCHKIFSLTVCNVVIAAGRVGVVVRMF